MNHALSVKPTASSDFPLPGEVFRLTPKQGALAVYLFLVHWLSQGHDRLTCSAICQSLHMSKRTVCKHLRALADGGLIQLEEHGDDLRVTLCPIADKVQREELEQLKIRLPRTPRLWHEQPCSSWQDDDRDPLPL